MDKPHTIARPRITLYPDITTVCKHVLGARYWAASHLRLPTLADEGYDGAGIGVFTPVSVVIDLPGPRGTARATPVKQPAGDQVLGIDNRAYNALLRGLRCLGERGFALLTGRWHALRRITASPRKIGDITKSALVLTHFENGRLT